MTISFLRRISYVTKSSMFNNNMKRMLNNAEAVENRLTDLKIKLQELKKIKIEEKINVLTAENIELKSKVECSKRELIKLETANGKKQYPIPGKGTAASCTPAAQETKPNDTTVVPSQEPTKTMKITSKKKEKAAVESPIDTVIDIRKLDFRIGKIIDINKHPDADSLYVEKVDCGETEARTVVSGLVNHVPIDEMRDRMVMVLCNLKPVKMRGVTSQAMVMCASSPEKVEVLLPPVGAVPGDLVHCEGFPREPESILNPKKKIFETCAPDLMTNDDRVACYKDKPLVVPGKGPVLSPTLKGVNVK